MKLIPYSLIDDSDTKSLLEAMVITQELNKKENTYSYSFISNKLAKILEMGDLRGKTILDLGCGSKYSGEKEGVEKDDIFEPWLSRALYKSGIKIIGIDKEDNSDEKFENYKIDLTKKDSLGFLGKNSIDIACAYALFDSNYMRSHKTNLFEHLLPQLEKIIKPEGQFIFETCCSGYRK